MAIPTILRHGGYTVRVLTRDHDPPHVHVHKSGGVAKVGLQDESGDVYPINQIGMSPKDLRLALEIVELHQTQLLSAWRVYHG